MKSPDLKPLPPEMVQLQTDYRKNPPPSATKASDKDKEVKGK